MDGVLLVNKESGLTSRDVVNIISKKFNTKKVGHTGTLDPLATGVLVVCLGKYTKLSELLVDTYKEYIAEIVLGLETDTLDITGNILKEIDTSFNKEEILKVIDKLKGTYLQEVPIYSAIKVDGKKLYEYARSNEMVTLPKREVEIKELELLNIYQDSNKTIIKIRCLVSKGTYIRALAKDIGLLLNSYGTIKSLQRTKQGKFKIEDAYYLKDVLDDKYKILNMNDVFNYKRITVSGLLEKKVRNGVPVEDIYNEPIIMFVDTDNNPICLYKKDKDNLRYYKKL